MTAKEGIPSWFFYTILVLVCAFFLIGTGVSVYSVSLVFLVVVIFGALKLSKRDDEKEWDAQIELQGGETKNG